MNWVFKLQDILPQIIEIKYRKGAHNTAADYISRHFPSIPSLITSKDQDIPPIQTTEQLETGKIESHC